MAAILSWPRSVNTLWNEQNGQHFAVTIFRDVYDDHCILIKILLKFGPKAIDN